MGEIGRAGERIAGSGRARAVGLLFATGVLAVVFLALLVADGVQAAGI